MSADAKRACAAAIGAATQRRSGTKIYDLSSLLPDMGSHWSVSCAALVVVDVFVLIGAAGRFDLKHEGVDLVLPLLHVSPTVASQ